MTERALEIHESHARWCAAELRRLREQLRVAREALVWIAGNDRGLVSVQNVAISALAQLDQPTEVDHDN